MFHAPPSMDNGSLNTIEDEIDMHCEDLFETAPIKFRVRKGNKLDAGIKEIIDDYDVKIPIVHVKDKLYLIGTSRIICDIKGENVMIR